MRALLWCCAILPLMSPAVFAAKPEPRVLRVAPVPFHVDMEKGIYVVMEQKAFCAYELDTGRKRWSHPMMPGDEYVHFSFGSRDAAFSLEDGVVVLDKETGRERWRRFERDCGFLHDIEYIDGGGWLAAIHDKGVMVYDPEGRGFRAPEPIRAQNTSCLGGWLPNERTLVLLQGSPPQDTESIYFWEVENGFLEKRYVLGGSGWVCDISPSGLMTYAGYSRNKNNRKLLFCDVYTGAIEKSMPMPEPFCGYADGQVILSLYWDDSFQLMDIETGETSEAIGMPGHRFIHETCTQAYGKTWLISNDAEANLWLWPVERSATPRKITNRQPGAYLPGWDSSRQSNRPMF